MFKTRNLDISQCIDQSIYIEYYNEYIPAPSIKYPILPLWWNPPYSAVNVFSSFYNVSLQG